MTNIAEAKEGKWNDRWLHDDVLLERPGAIWFELGEKAGVAGRSGWFGPPKGTHGKGSQGGGPAITGDGNREAVAALMNEMPAGMMAAASLKEIEITAAGSAYLEHGGKKYELSGAYLPDHDKIVLYKKASEGTLSHEVGHAVWKSIGRANEGSDEELKGAAQQFGLKWLGAIHNGEDGISAYSTRIFEHVRAGEASLPLAANETFAEMSRLYTTRGPMHVNNLGVPGLSEAFLDLMDHMEDNAGRWSALAGTGKKTSGQERVIRVYLKDWELADEQTAEMMIVSTYRGDELVKEEILEVVNE